MNIPEFKDKQLLEQVFTHRSYLNESKKVIHSNERLEFLGDSILSFVVSSHIFKEFSDFEEGQLTSMRSVLTNTQSLFLVSRELGLGEKLRMSRGEEASGGRENKTTLANTYEALVGGLYVDQGYEAAEEFIRDTILSRADALIASQGLKDAKSTLQEKTQEAHKLSPLYKILNEVGPDHAKQYTVGVFLEDKLLAQGIGSSKQEAEKEAARNALETFKA